MDSSPAAPDLTSSSTPPIPRRPAATFTPLSPKSGYGGGDNASTSTTHVGSPPPDLAFPSITVDDDDDNEDLGYDQSTPHPPQVASALLGSPGLLAPADLKRGLLRSDTGMPAMAEDDPPSAGGSTVPSPFNFQTQAISTSPVKSNIGQRRGHRYKHSSISTQHQIFQEPPQRPPPVLPASLPVPTVREAWKSMSRDQRVRLYWSLCHLTVASWLFFISEGSLAMMALSHLVFFDAGSAAVCVAVDVLGNFEVWRRSSIRHPFGLERAEVLAGFAMSIFLLFGGFDLVSHNLKHWLETKGGHEPHHEHIHERVSAGEVDWAAFAAITSTAVSAYGLKNHARIARIMRVSWLAKLPTHFSNIFHFLTVFFSSLLLLLPLLSIKSYIWLDRTLCAAIAASMFLFGAKLAMAQAMMLLMSYGGIGGNEGVSSVMRDIEAEPGVTRIEDAQFWQVHYGLCMANLKISVAKGCDEGAISKLRSRISTLIQNRLGEGYGRGTSLRWEVTLQTSVDAAF
ncbi:cation diffusion facilitator family transporter [Colletotrichum graminicola]|uniref:Zinc transporter n=1 Tax=Colletotrichum graminicola (strain M1.001 / M2 / FGSC 10212) TaxID=645133 RepID=E3QBA9_COLGM|nr:cation diffusion facilitator family transporter [Colletotrichum graminicola M1.001]EFQ28147.1 cation diffusion facilitator family transporter [Colletotrichum graminicola M1.001]WDK11852.1 cation diffusion facilitator family transporter [Colletotrichum graminicola]